MEIEDGDKYYAINTILGYRKIVWKIKGYLPWTCGKIPRIRSPVFCIRSPQLSKWRFCLLPKFVHGTCFATMYLERCDSFPLDVEVKWILCYPVEDGKEVITENAATFGGLCAFGTEIDGIIDIEHKLAIKEKRDDLVVRCSMIVYSADDRKVLERSSDPGLKALSQDLLLLLRVKGGYDTKLYTPNAAFIHIHRAILCCRSSFFKSLITDEGIVDFVYPYGDIKEATTLISFLYTGDLKYVFRSPSFSMGYVIERYNIDELYPYYPPDNLTIKTEFFEEETKFVWTVANLNEITKGSLWSHRMRALANEKNCRVGLYPRGFSGREEFMSLRVKFTGRKQPGNMCIYFGILDRNKKSSNVRVIRRFHNDCRSIVFTHFVTRDILKDPRFTVKGRLKLFCRFRRSTGGVNMEVNDSATCPVSINKDMHFRILSKQIASLYETGEYSDYTIECGMQLFKVHRMIISCRSHVLARMVANEGDNSFLSLTDIEPNILDIILHYLYSGVLKRCEPDENLKIYHASKRFGVLPLQKQCCLILELNLNVQNVVKILFAAHKNNDSKLKFAAFNFICGKINDINDTFAQTQQ